MATLNECLLIGRNPDGMFNFYPSTLVLISLVPLGPFDGLVAAVVEDFVCTTPNQKCIFLPSMKSTDLKLRADVRYGPDDPTLWPQPWVDNYCHLGAIPRKPVDPDDLLSIMWWDPTCDDFISFGNGSVDGIGVLSGSKLLSLRNMLSTMEGRIEDHKRAFLNPNKHLLMLVSCAWLRLFTLLSCLFGPTGNFI